MILPSAGSHLWSVYSRLRRRKGGTGFGASPIEWPDIHAFMSAAVYPLAPWEIEIIEDLDDAYLAEQARGMKDRADNPPPKSK